MIFRIHEDRLYVISINNKADENEFLKRQKNGKIKFIKVDYEHLPKPLFEMSETFYQYDKDGKTIIVDRERTIAEWTKQKHTQIQSMILKHYPQIKQSSDLADKLYFETTFTASGVTDLQKIVYDIIVAVKTGTSFDNAFDDVDTKMRHGIEQLVKTGLRVKWIMECKAVIKQSLEQLTEPKYPPFPDGL